MDIGIKKLVMTGLLAAEVGFGVAIVSTSPSLGDTVVTPDETMQTISETAPDDGCVDSKCIRRASIDERPNANGYHRPIVATGVGSGLKLY